MKNTVSLEVAQLLKENGWEQDAWKGKQYCVGYWEKEWDILCCMNCIEDFNDYEFINAPQLHDILDELPEYVDKPDTGGYDYKRYFLSIEKEDGTYCACYDNDVFESILFDFTDPNPHNAAALLWIELKKNNFLPNKQ